jgi:hypothetical protein
MTFNDSPNDNRAVISPRGLLRGKGMILDEAACSLTASRNAALSFASEKEVPDMHTSGQSASWSSQLLLVPIDFTG